MSGDSHAPPHVFPPQSQVRLKVWAALRDHPNATFLATNYDEGVPPYLRTSSRSCATCSYRCRQCLDPKIFALPAGSRHGTGPRLTSTKQYQGFFLNSTFCMMMRGDYEGSLKFTEIILAGCIPVLISDMPAWPFASRLNYREFSYEFDWAEASARPLGIVKRLLQIPEHELKAKRAALMDVRGRFFYRKDTEQKGAARELIKEMCAGRANRRRVGGPSSDLPTLYRARQKDAI